MYIIVLIINIDILLLLKILIFDNHSEMRERQVRKVAMIPDLLYELLLFTLIVSINENSFKYLIGYK